MKTLFQIAALLLVLTTATRAGYAELHVMTQEQRDCLNQLLNTLDHRSLISHGAKIEKISFDQNPYVSVTVIYDRDEAMITRTCVNADI